MQDSFLNSPLLYSIALTLIHFLWQGVVIALALKSVLFFIPLIKSQLRYAFASGAMILNFIVPLTTFFIIYKPDYFLLTRELSTPLLQSFELNQTAISHYAWVKSTLEYLPYLTMLWVFIISILSLKLLIELYSVNQLSKQNTLIPDNALYLRFKALSSQVGLEKTPRFLLSLNIHVPMAIGWLKPIVLLPVSMLTGLTPAQLDMLLLHELAHIRRHDYLVNFIQSLVEIVLFYHPCVLWVSNQMRNEREYCSDDIAVEHSGNSIAYAHALADTASLCNKHRNHSIPNMAMAASGGDLTLRVLRLVNTHHCASSNQMSKWFASLAIIAVLLFISSQQLIQILTFELNTSSGHSISKSIETLTPNNTKKFETNKVTKNHVIPEIEVQAPATTLSELEAKLAPQDSLFSETLTTYQGKYVTELALEKIEPSVSTSSKQKILQKKQVGSNENTQENINNAQIQPIVNQPIKETTNPRLSFEVDQNVYYTNSPELVYFVEPKYPVKAKLKGVESEITVNFSVDNKGYVKDIDFPSIKYQRNYFKSSVRVAMDKWRFIPAYHNGKAVESRMSKIFSFSLAQ